MDKATEITFLIGEASSLLEFATELAREAGRTSEPVALEKAAYAAKRASQRLDMAKQKQDADHD